jgi:glucose/arabinose dehydrogenase
LEDVEPPALFYHEPMGMAGIEFYAADELPELTGALLFCQYHGNALHAVTFDLDGDMVEDSIIASGCSSDVLTGPDGFVYFLDIVTGTVHRISRP